MISRQFILDTPKGQQSRRIPHLLGLITFASIAIVCTLCGSLWQADTCNCPAHPADAGSSAGCSASVVGDASSSSRALIDVTGGSDGQISHAGKSDGNRPFIYVYETGPNLTDKMLGLSRDWYSTQYDVEMELTRLLYQSNAVRTTDPDQATLFYIPYYSSHHLLHVFKNKRNNMWSAVQEVSKAWSGLLTQIRHDFPFFNRTNGRDHFSTITVDHGRCHSLTFVDPKLFGEMFFVMLNGDRLARTAHASKRRNLQVIGYNYGNPVDLSYPDTPCYLPDRDIPVPAFITDHVPLVTPGQTERNIRAIFRFAAAQEHGDPLRHHGHDLRKELLKLYRNAGIPHWDFAVQNELVSDLQWQRSVFCICPPGHSQWTSRPFKALISGCIPVTFFREHDNPWEDQLDYSAFSINIDPDDHASLREVIEAANVTQLQENVVKVQKLFKWSGGIEWGAEVMLLDRLRRRGDELRRLQVRVQ